MTFPLPGILLDMDVPASLSITTASGATPQAWKDPYGIVSQSLPVTATVPTLVFLAPGTYTVTGADTSQTVTLEGNLVATVGPLFNRPGPERNDTAANWTSLNPVLRKGEVGIESDTDKFKIGDGTSTWSALSYASGGGGGSGTISDITSTGSTVTVTGATGPTTNLEVANPVAYSASAAAVGQANSAGVATTESRGDHVHQGVTSVTAGSNITVTGGDGSGHGALTIAASASGSGALTLISRQVLAAPAATVTFSSIPGTYENLVLEITGAVSDTASGESINMQFNGDTAAHYDYVGLYAVTANTGQVGAQATTSGQVGTFPGTTAPTNQGAMATTRIVGYARTVFNKTWTSLFECVQGTAANNISVQMGMGNWRSNAAITSISLTDGGGGNFIAGSVFSLYGES